MNDTNERSVASAGYVQPLAWGVMPGDNLPLWRCSSRRQAEEVVVWLRKQRPASTPQAVPLVDGCHPPTITDAEREAVNDAIYLCEAEAGLFGERAAATKWATCAAVLHGLLERLGGGR